MAAQVMTNHHHVTFSGSAQALRHSSPGPTTSMSANGLMNGSYQNGHTSLTIVEHDNPFRPGSELIEEAESILKSVTIVGSQVLISGQSNDSGIVAASPSRQNVGSPAAANGSASHANETNLQCSTILSTSSSTPAGHGQLRVEVDPFTVQRASPESLRPESPPLRAEHVVVSTSGDVKSTPAKKQPAEDPSNPFKDQKLIEEASVAVAAASTSQNAPGKSGTEDGKKSKKKKKKCTIL